MACDDWKREQDAARQQWTTANNLACDTAFTSETAQCHAAHAQRLNSCNAIQCNSFTNCNAIQCTSYTNCNDYWATDPRRYFCWTARGVCVAAAAVALAACWVARGVCVASAAVARAACIAGSVVILAACLAAAWAKSIACKAATAVANIAWAAGVAVAWAACKVYEIVIIPIVGWVNGVVSNMIDWFRGAKPDQPEDIVPDFSGVNFDRRDEAGNVIPFIWGVSTASFQVEGGIENNDWYHFTQTQSVKDRVTKLGSAGRTTLRIESAGRAVDHWDVDVLREDLDRAQLLGLNAYRFSLEWARIQPTKPAWAQTVITKRKEARDALFEARSERELAARDESDADRHIAHAEELEAQAARLEAEARTAIDTPYDKNEFDSQPIQRYVEMVQDMQDRGLQPIMTMMHMSLPDWVLMPPQRYDVLGWGAAEDDRYWNSLRGWETDATVAAFRKFVRFVTPFFKDDVKYFVTMNEPIGTVTGGGYMAGIFPPGFLGAGDKGRAAYHNLVDAHIAAYDEIKAIVPADAKVGVSHWVGLARRAPQTIASKLFIGDNEAAKNQWHYAVNQYFLDAIVLGHRNPDIWRKNTPSIVEESKNKVDFISPQYYRACDIYHDVGIALTAPWWGGQFTGDLRNGTNYLTKYLWNDLGWTIYPGGLYHLLKDIYNRYSKPILITENGMCEKQDRNRAAYTISHLQQVLRAIKDGVDIIGYVHWSIVDNFEWAFGYQDSGHFGLFSVDRDTDPNSNNLKSFPRHITEGALAYQYLIANSRRITQTNSADNPFEAPVARFGTITGNGLEVQAPEQLAGALWNGRFPRSGDGPPFMLYLSRLPANQWLGMIFFQDTHRWVRLQNITWRSDDGDDGTLMFRHPVGENAGDFAEYVAATVVRGSPRTDTRLRGTVTTGGTEKSWVAERVVRAGVWKSTGGFPSFIAINRLEGDYGEWHAKYIYGKPHWAPAATSVSWSGTDVTITVQELSDIDTIAAQLTGDMLRATITLIGGGGGATIQWEGKRLPEDIPF